MPNVKFLASTVPKILGDTKIPKVGHVHGCLQDFFPGVGKLWVWERKSSSGSRDGAQVEVWGQSPQEADDRL